MLVGVDIGGTKIAACVARPGGEPLAMVRQPTERADLPTALRATILAALTAAGLAPTAVSAIAVGVPGLVDRAGGRVELATNLGIVEPLPLAARLAADFPVPIVLENDVRLAALGVHAHLGLSSLAYVSLGTGLAAGLVLANRLWRGHNNMAGEIGQIRTGRSGKLLEAQIAGPAIVRRAQARGLALEQASELFTRAAAGNARAGVLATAVGRQIAWLVQWLVLTYDVEKVVLGGGVTRADAAFLAPILAALAGLRAENALNRRLLPDEIVLVLPDSVEVALRGALALAAAVEERTT